MKLKISPSMMCADIAALSEVLKTFEKNGVDYLHIDVMDGSFVQNFTLGTDYCRQLKRLTDIPLDIHLMIESPENKLSWFEFGEGDIVSVHAESTGHLQKALAFIRSRGAGAYVALNPATPLSALDEVLDDFDGVLIMSVNPGFAGQKMIPASLGKIKRLREYLDTHGRTDAEIEVDGNVSFENSVKMKNAGANVFVVGSSAVFSPDFSLDDGIKKLKDCLGNED